MTVTVTDPSVFRPPLDAWRQGSTSVTEEPAHTIVAGQPLPIISTHA